VATSSSNRQKGLRWAGLIVGLAWVGWMLFAFLASCKQGFEESHLFNLVLLYILPFLVMVAVAWKWPLIGGILLIAVGLFWLVFVLIMEIGSSMTLRDLLRMLAGVPLAWSLPMLVSGVLFLLSRKRE
jgi:hypothetical protein